MQIVSFELDFLKELLGIEGEVRAYGSEEDIVRDYSIELNGKITERIENSG